MRRKAFLSIREAADILGIGDRASINEIRSRYRALVKEWHPDISDHEPEDSHAAMIRLNEAYDVLMQYCINYEFSFRNEDLANVPEPDPLAAWMEQYGDDPIWGPYRSRRKKYRK